MASVGSHSAKQRAPTNVPHNPGRSRRGTNPPPSAYSAVSCSPPARQPADVRPWGAASTRATAQVDCMSSEAPRRPSLASPERDMAASATISDTRIVAGRVSLAEAPGTSEPGGPGFAAARRRRRQSCAARQLCSNLAKGAATFPACLLRHEVTLTLRCVAEPQEHRPEPFSVAALTFQRASRQAASQLGDFVCSFLSSTSRCRNTTNSLAIAASLSEINGSIGRHGECGHL